MGIQHHRYKKWPFYVAMLVDFINIEQNESVVCGHPFNGLTHDELMAPATCYSEGEVTNYRLQIIIDKHSTNIAKLLKAHYDKGAMILRDTHISDCQTLRLIACLPRHAGILGNMLTISIIRNTVSS